MIIKSSAFENYTVLENDTLRDKNISLKAKGLLALIASLPSNWKIRKSNLHEYSNDGRDSAIAAFDELIVAGYIESVRSQTTSGIFDGWEYTVYPNNRKNEKKPFPEKPFTEKPFTENPVLQRKEDTKERITKDIPDIVSHLNAICKTAFRLNSKSTIKHINARLHEGFTLADFKMVIEFKNSKWSLDEKMREYLRPETLFGTKFESYLQEAKRNAPRARVAHTGFDGEEIA